MKTWIEPEEVYLSEDFKYAIGGHPIFLKALIRRGLKDIDKAKAFLNPDYYVPSPSSELPGMKEAVERIERAIKQGEEICVWGDFDVDGQTSTTVLYSTILDLGGNASYYIPLRHTESHGLNIQSLERIINRGAKLILTCDTGIAAVDEVKYANEKNIDVIVTDHHDLPSVLPSALAIVNPKTLPFGHPLRELPGVGCAYKLAEELYRKSNREKEVKKYLDLVALGIVSDIAVQINDTRYLLQKGLDVLRKTERLGLKVIMEVAGIKSERISEEHIGFAIGPRLNSLGRLSDANQAVELLTTQDIERARILSNLLDGLNVRRKLLCDQVFQAAQDKIKKEPSLLDYQALVIYHLNWPQGVIGIVASRLVEIYNKPTIIITGSLDEKARGSARSTQNCNITLAISKNSDLLITFGGHPMAAGLSMAHENIQPFRKALSKTIEEMTGNTKNEDILHIDSYLKFSELTLELIDDIMRISPFGPGNSPLIFVTKNLTVKGHSKIGPRGEHRQLIIEDEEGNECRVLWWGSSSIPVPAGKFDLAYIPRATNYQGQKELQLEWIDSRNSFTSVTVRKSEKKEVKDYRGKENPMEILMELENAGNVQILVEGEKEIKGKSRYELTSGKDLAIWTIPPGPWELKQILIKTYPSMIYLFCKNPQLNRLDVFLTHLSGMIKYSLKHNNGSINIKKLAGATGHREITVKKAIEWMEGRGYIHIIKNNGDEIIIKEGYKIQNRDLNKITEELKLLIDETNAYREYFLKADKDKLGFKSITGE